MFALAEESAAFLDELHIQLILCMMELQPAFVDGKVNCFHRDGFT